MTKELCVDCNEDCNWGSGKFVNRYPADRINNKGEWIGDGYRCGWCASRVDEELAELMGEE
tara:strand:+ start:554 stop:736 length:183 start_codon:yes stop_codon:yes gene_type:complete